MPTSPQTLPPLMKTSSPGVEEKDEVDGSKERAEVGKEMVHPSLVLEKGRMAWLGDHLLVNIV